MTREVHFISRGVMDKVTEQMSNSIKDSDNIRNQGKSGWFERTGWKSNPFVLDIRPELIAGHEKEISALRQNIDEGQKYILITGATGSGKTTMLKYISREYAPIYIPKPPKDKDEFVEIFRSMLIKPGLIDRLLGRDSFNVYNITNEVNRKLRGQRMIFLVDEAHETDIHVLEWLRAIIDQIDGATLVIAGLPVIKKTHLEKLETLRQRITADIELLTLSRDETFELIMKRIASCGGRKLEPFTYEALIEVHNRSGGFPRETIKICNELVHQAIERDSSIIDSTFFAKKDDIDKAIDAKESLDVLTDKQKEIVAMLAEKKGLTPSEIAEIMTGDEYQSKTHALRAINNILKRLETNNVIVREKRGRSFIYRLSPKLKNAMIEA